MTSRNSLLTPLSDSDLDKLYDARFKCCVLSLDYDFTRHVGRVIMREWDCCDMIGCIEVFEKIDPKVKEVETYSGEKLDTFYRLGEDSQWAAFQPR